MAKVHLKKKIFIILKKKSLKTGDFLGIFRRSKLTAKRYVSVLSGMTLRYPYGAAQPAHGSRKLDIRHKNFEKKNQNDENDKKKTI